MVLLRALIRAADAMGVDPRVFCARLDLGMARVEEDASVPTLLLARAWLLAPELSGDPLFGLHAGEHAELGAYDVLDYLFYTSATLEQALRSTEQFQRVLSDIWRVELIVEPDVARFRHWVPDDYVQPLWHAWDYFFSGSFKRVRAVLGPGVVPRAVRMMHAPAEPRAEYERCFGCAVEFDQPIGEFVFDAAILKQPLLSSNPSLHRVVRRHAHELLARVSSDRDLLVRARTLLPDLLPDRRLSLAMLAVRLGVSTRTLQRGLGEHGTGYKQLIDQVREELAVRRLEPATLSVQEVATSLGFDSQASFTRAFRRWRGESPTAFQKAAKARQRG
jgi:AraC-like DNA-binding protein